ncbi:loricrin-like [Coturnix japonica]|uniref:loricrin-like n=1 Tax=Coturnix japonica TaxID=93934 RepID=UPI0013A5C413|nr:loricrin-like [Coturnix japonica]
MWDLYKTAHVLEIVISLLSPSSRAWDTQHSAMCSRQDKDQCHSQERYTRQSSGCHSSGGGCHSSGGSSGGCHSSGGSSGGCHSSGGGGGCHSSGGGGGCHSSGSSGGCHSSGGSSCHGKPQIQYHYPQQQQQQQQQVHQLPSQKMK